MEMPSVYIQKLDLIKYPKEAPFHPHEIYPEYPFEEISKGENYIYEGIRNLLYLMGLDRERWNTEKWNPFKNVINPGDTILIKPNLVLDNDLNQQSTTTHTSLIRAITDYVYIAMKGAGQIIVGDAPLQSCNLDKLIKINGLQNTISFLKSKKIDIRLEDFRMHYIIKKERKNVKLNYLKGDSKGYTIINLKEKSNLKEISYEDGYQSFRVANYDPNLMKKAHNLIDHKYLISNSVLKADVVIQIPKFKSHRIAGITGCLKNVIGINGHKDWLPHHRKGSIFKKGDEYLYSHILKKFLTYINEKEDNLLIYYHNLHRFLHYPLNLFRYFIFGALLFTSKEQYLSGGWYGNDTLWRTIADLNQILIYCDKNGKLTQQSQRKRLYFCDAVICGDREGPLHPKSNKTGLILGGYDPLLIDLTMAELINFDYKKIPHIFNLLHLLNRKISKFEPKELKIFSNNKNWNKINIAEVKEKINFIPTKGWMNYIEKK